MSSFQEQLEQHYNDLSDDSALKTIRQKAWDQFQIVGLPQKNQEVWRSIKLRKLYDKSIASAPSGQFSLEEIEPLIIPGFEQRCLVLTNGKWNTKR